MKSKLYSCKFEGCDWEGSILSKGLCPYHRSMELGKDKPKKRYYIPQKTEKGTERRKKAREGLGDFFQDKISELTKNPYSENTGDPISEPSSLNIAHVLDKSRHRSVQTHPSNCIFLTWDEHTRMDKLLFESRFKELSEEMPNTWKLYKKRFEILEEFCVERTKFKAKLTEYIENE